MSKYLEALKNKRKKYQEGSEVDEDNNIVNEATITPDDKGAPTQIDIERPETPEITDVKEGLAPDISTDPEASAAFVTAPEDVQQISDRPTTDQQIAQDVVATPVTEVQQVTPAQAATEIQEVRAAQYDPTMTADLDRLSPAEMQQAAGQFAQTEDYKNYEKLSKEILGSEEYKEKLSELENLGRRIDLTRNKATKANLISKRNNIQNELTALQAPLKTAAESLKVKQNQYMENFRKDLLGEVPQGQAVTVLNQVDVTKKISSKEAGQKLASETNINSELSDDIANDPVGAIEKVEGADLESRTNIADLPEEALMSTQMEGLLAGMEEGKTPLWAKPAVDKVNAMMAARGMTASTVGRDALFSAIIQAAMPIAQDNAKALQARAAQKLDAAVQFKKQEAEFEQQMTITNLANRQQAFIQSRELRQQRLLSDQNADNAAKQFNAANQQQTDQFMATMKNNISQFNASQDNAMRQFNASEVNRINALNAGNQLQADQFNAQLDQDAQKFYESNVLAREQFNATNAQAIQQSDLAWRRNTNTAATAAYNAANQQNVQNEYNITALEQAQIWLQTRDALAYIRQSYENEEQRIAQLYATAIGNESGMAKGGAFNTASKTSTYIDKLFE
jgi:hypothetical protein